MVYSRFYFYILLAKYSFLLKEQLTYWIYLKKYFFKKYIYTINHKRIALNYLYFTILSGLSGAALATFIRFELGSPGSHFFKGDSIKYLQVITAHGLVMIFYVVIPLIFGLFANFFIPYHIGSKDVAFPRLNSIGFWLLPAGYILLSRPAFLRRQVYKSWNPYDAYISTQYDAVEQLLFKEIVDKNIDVLQNNFEFFSEIDSAQYFKTSGTYFYQLNNKELFNYFLMLDSWFPNVLLKKNFNLVSTQSNLVSGFSSFDLKSLYLSAWTRKSFIDNIVDTEKYLPKLTSWNETYLTANYLIKNQEKSKTFLEKTVNWTDYLLLWEYNFGWVFNAWQVLKNSKEYKNIFLKDNKCNSPTFVMSGWTFITPFSSNLRFSGLGAQDAGIISIIFAGLSTTISFTNLLITRRVLSASGIKNRKTLLPFLTISLLLTMRMLSLITPVLASAMIMLLSDRHFGTAYFDYAYGGDTILFHHLFWFFGHPEVYVVIIPGFGIVNMLLPYYTMRRITSKTHLIWATYVMAYMGFLVWGHHMYLVGLDHRSRSLYSTITVMISLPAVVKIVNWTLTFTNSSLRTNIPLLFAISFICFFLSGGLTGLWLSHVSLNIFVHDTFFVVAHFHFLFSSATFSAIFAGLYFYYGILFGVKYNRLLSYLHFVFWNCGQWLTFMPLYWVGYNGLPRRYHDYPMMYAVWQSLSTSGHLLTMISFVFFFFMIFESKLFAKVNTISSFYYSRLFKQLLYFKSKKMYME